MWAMGDPVKEKHDALFYNKKFYYNLNGLRNKKVSFLLEKKVDIAATT